MTASIQIKFGICVFLDLHKVFYMVNKQILLSTLFTYGIRDLTHKLLRSYLENRQQYVTNNSTDSSTSLVRMGVPQGSNFRPLLFLILELNLFADDSSIYTSHIVMKLTSIIL